MHSSENTTPREAKTLPSDRTLVTSAAVLTCSVSDVTEYTALDAKFTRTSTERVSGVK
jgi:hypothetical protein